MWTSKFISILIINDSQPYCQALHTLLPAISFAMNFQYECHFLCLIFAPDRAFEPHPLALSNVVLKLCSQNLCQIRALRNFGHPHLDQLRLVGTPRLSQRVWLSGGSRVLCLTSVFISSSVFPLAAQPIHDSRVLIHQLHESRPMNVSVMFCKLSGGDPALSDCLRNHLESIEGLCTIPSKLAWKLTPTLTSTAVYQSIPPTNSRDWISLHVLDMFSTCHPRAQQRDSFYFPSFLVVLPSAI